MALALKICEESSEKFCHCFIFLHVHNVAFSQARGGDCYVCVVLINASINVASTYPQRKEVLIPFVVLSSSCFGGVCAYSSSQTAWLEISQ